MPQVLPTHSHSTWLVVLIRLAAQDARPKCCDESVKGLQRNVFTLEEWRIITSNSAALVGVAQLL